MMIKTGASDQSIVIRALDTTSGLPFTTLNGATAGLQMFYRRGFAASVGVSAITIADLTTSHTDGGLNHIHSGYYRFDPPDAAWSTGVDRVLVGGSATGVMILGQVIQLAGYNLNELTTLKIDRLLAIDGKSSSATQATILANTNNIDGKASSANMATVLTRTAFIDGLATSVALNTVGGNVSAIQLSLSRLDNLNGLATSAALNVVGGNVSAIQLSLSRLDNLNGLATSATQATILTNTQLINGLATSATLQNVGNNVSAIQLSLSRLDNLNGLATSAALATVGGNVSAIQLSLSRLDNLNGLATSAVLQNVGNNVSAIQLSLSRLDNLNGLATSATQATILTNTQLINGLATSTVINLANIRQQVTDGLSLIGLDHLIGVSAVDTDIADGSLFAQLGTSTGDFSSFNKNEHSLQVLAAAGGLTTSQVRQQMNEALSAIHLDHLLAVSATDTDIATGAFLAQLAASSADWSQFAMTTDSLEAIRDRGDAAWTTGAGGNLNDIRQQVTDGLSLIGLDHLISASAVSGDVATGALLAQIATSTGSFSSFNKNDHSLQTLAGAAGLTTSQVRQQVDEALSAIHLDHLLFASSLDTNVADGSIFAQIATSTGDFSSFNKDGHSLQSISQGAGLTTSQVRQQMNEALSAIHLDHLLAASAAATDIVDGSFFAQMATSAGSWSTFVKDTDSLEALRNRGDAAWVTADVNGLATSAIINLSNVRQQVTDGLSLIGLDHLFAASANDADIATGSFWTQVATSSGDWSDFVKTTDSLEAIRNNTAWNTADVNGLATSVALAGVSTNVSAIQTSLSRLDNLNGLATSLVLNSVSTNVSAIQVSLSRLDNLNGLATSVALANVGTNVSAIQVSLSRLDNLNGLATSAALNTVGTNVSAIQVSLSSVQTAITAASNAEQNTINIQSRLPAALVGGKMDSNVGSVAGNVDAASRMSLGASMIVPGTAITGTLTTTCMTTDLTEDTNDHFNGRTIIFTSGALKFQATDITDYDGGTKLLVYTGLTEAPANGTGFIIV